MIRQDALPAHLDKEVASAYLLGVDRRTAGKAFDQGIWDTAADMKGFVSKEQLLERSGVDKATVLADVARRGASELEEPGAAPFKADAEFMMRCVALDESALFKADAELLHSNRNFVLQAVQKDGFYFLEKASTLLRADRDVVSAACQNNGMALRFASPVLRDDDGFVICTVQRCGIALQFASARLRDTKPVCLAAVQADREALRMCSTRMRGEKELILVAVASSGLMLALASVELKDDLEVVLRSVRRTPDALKHASRRLRGDREVVLAAVAGGSHTLGGGKGACVRFVRFRLNSPETTHMLSRRSLHPLNRQAESSAPTPRSSRTQRATRNVKMQDIPAPRCHRCRCPPPHLHGSPPMQAPPPFAHRHSSMHSSIRHRGPVYGAPKSMPKRR